ncbi:hypothetical protein BD779DRAFT_1469678 [Infundibulicybe gibba]|nr:hypothetical protein BD779DRAFT_1469678 [Infundibulicybe gibba]
MSSPSPSIFSAYSAQSGELSTTTSTTLGPDPSRMVQNIGDRATIAQVVLSTFNKVCRAVIWAKLQEHRGVFFAFLTLIHPIPARANFCRFHQGGAYWKPRKQGKHVNTRPICRWMKASSMRDAPAHPRASGTGCKHTSPQLFAPPIYMLLASPFLRGYGADLIDADPYARHASIILTIIVICHGV